MKAIAIIPGTANVSLIDIERFPYSRFKVALEHHSPNEIKVVIDWAV